MKTKLSEEEKKSILNKGYTYLGTIQLTEQAIIKKIEKKYKLVEKEKCDCSCHYGGTKHSDGKGGTGKCDCKGTGKKDGM